MPETASPKKSKSPKRMSISLSGDAAWYLEKLSKEQGISQTEFLRKAILTEAYFHEAIQEGARILLQQPDKEIKEIVFR